MWQLFLYFLGMAGLPEVSESVFPSARGFPEFRKVLFRRRGVSRSFGKHFSVGAGLPEVSESVFPSARGFPKFRKVLFRRRGVFRRFGKHLNVGRAFPEASGKVFFADKKSPSFLMRKNGELENKNNLFISSYNPNNETEFV